MNIEKVINYFGSKSKLAKAVGVSRATIYIWVHKGSIPLKRQMVINQVTKGKFKVDLKAETKKIMDRSVAPLPVRKSQRY